MRSLKLDTVDKVMKLRENYLLQLKSLDELAFVFLLEMERQDWKEVGWTEKKKYQKLLKEVRTRRLENKNAK